MLGKRVRELREEQNFLLRQLAAKLEMDMALLSKKESGERFFKKEEIIEISKVLNTDTKELLVLWLTDKIVKTIREEDYQKESLELALNLIEKDYGTSN